MSEHEIRLIADSADVIIDGYAFNKMEDGNYRVFHMNMPYHAAVFQKNGHMIETSMDDIELAIATEYLNMVTKYQELMHA